MATIQLDYFVNQGLLAQADTAAISGATLNQPGELDILGMSISGDTTTYIGSGLGGQFRRRVTLLTNAFGDSLYPNAAALEAATKNLWTTTLAKSVPGTVSAADPVVT